MTKSFKERKCIIFNNKFGSNEAVHGNKILLIILSFLIVNSRNPISRQTSCLLLQQIMVGSQLPLKKDKIRILISNEGSTLQGLTLIGQHPKSYNQIVNLVLERLSELVRKHNKNHSTSHLRKYGVEINWQIINTWTRNHHEIGKKIVRTNEWYNGECIEYSNIS